jgi:hypothetical protein
MQLTVDVPVGRGRPSFFCAGQDGVLRRLGHRSDVLATETSTKLDCSS